MAFGTLAFDTLQTSDSKNTSTNKTLDTSFVYNGSARSWIRMNSAATIRDSFNISSASDDGTGDYSVTFTNNMDNGSNISGAANAFTSSSLLATYHTGSTSGYNIDVHNHSDSNTDSGSSHQTFGELA